MPCLLLARLDFHPWRVRGRPVSWEGRRPVCSLSRRRGPRSWTYRARQEHAAGPQTTWRGPAGRCEKAGHSGRFRDRPDITRRRARGKGGGTVRSDVLARSIAWATKRHQARGLPKVTTRLPGCPGRTRRLGRRAGWNAVSGRKAFGGQGLPLRRSTPPDPKFWSASKPSAFGLLPRC